MTTVLMPTALYSRQQTLPKAGRTDGWTASLPLVFPKKVSVSGKSSLGRTHFRLTKVY